MKTSSGINKQHKTTTAATKSTRVACSCNGGSRAIINQQCTQNPKGCQYCCEDPKCTVLSHQQNHHKKKQHNKGMVINITIHTAGKPTQTFTLSEIAAASAGPSRLPTPALAAGSIEPNGRTGSTAPVPPKIRRPTININGSVYTMPADYTFKQLQGYSHEYFLSDCCSAQFQSLAEDGIQTNYLPINLNCPYIGTRLEEPYTIKGCQHTVSKAALETAIKIANDSQLDKFRKGIPDLMDDIEEYESQGSKSEALLNQCREKLAKYQASLALGMHLVPLKCAACGHEYTCGQVYQNKFMEHLLKIVRKFDGDTLYVAPNGNIFSDESMNRESIIINVASIERLLFPEIVAERKRAQEEQKRQQEQKRLQEEQQRILAMLSGKGHFEFDPIEIM